MYTIGEFIIIKEDELHYSVSLNPQFMNTNKKIIDLYIDSGLLYIKDIEGNLLDSKPIKITKFPFDTMSLMSVLNESLKATRKDNTIKNDKALPFMYSQRGFEFVYHILYKNPLRALAIRYPMLDPACFGYVEVVNNTLRVLGVEGHTIYEKDIEDFSLDLDKNKSIISDIEHAIMFQVSLIKNDDIGKK